MRHFNRTTVPARRPPHPAGTVIPRLRSRGHTPQSHNPVHGLRYPTHTPHRDRGEPHHPMSMRRCPASKCPRLINNKQRYCTQHQAEYEARRGTPTQRGYDARHRALRRQWQARLQQHGSMTCNVCNQPITPQQAWDLEHTDSRGGYLGPAHATCNRSKGGTKGAKTKNKK